jgi:hypothetical protein
MSIGGLERSDRNETQPACVPSPPPQGAALILLEEDTQAVWSEATKTKGTLFASPCLFVAEELLLFLGALLFL